MNTICISGRLTKKPSLKLFPTFGNDSENQSTLCIIYIANDVYYGEAKTTSFLKVVAWGSLGKVIAQHCSVGSEVFVTGRVEQYHYKDENSVDHYEVQIVVERFNFGGQVTFKK